MNEGWSQQPQLSIQPSWRHFLPPLGPVCPRYYHPPRRTPIRSDILRALSHHIDIKTSSVSKNNLFFAD